MANSAQARKRARQAAKANVHNSALRSKLRTAIKATRRAIEAGDTSKASEVFRHSCKTIDIIADKDIIHKNKAARHKSRLIFVNDIFVRNDIDGLAAMSEYFRRFRC